MLLSLHIENIAVIKSVDIDFSRGFSALTGETGAGKSIIIDSINLLLGKKFEKDLIRHGEDTAMVSGLFSAVNKNQEHTFESLGVYPDDEGNILIQRSVNTEGRSQVRVNGRAVSLSVLKDLTSLLVNIHGQSDTHELAEPSNHLKVLDLFASNEELLKKYSEKYSVYDAILKEINTISEQEKERARLVEILEYQIKDIDAAALKPGEEEALVEKKVKIKNSERITKQAGFVYKALKGSEKGSVSYLLDRSVSALEALSDVVPEFSEYAEKLRDFNYYVRDVAEEVYAVVDDIEEDPTDRLNKIEARLDKIDKLKRKYGLTVEEVLAFREKSAEELSKLQNSEEYLKELEKKKKEAYLACVEIADKLHENRVKAAKMLEENVKSTLEYLDMPKVVFFASIKINSKDNAKLLSSKGYESVEFFISANSGMEAKSICRIASGGELARIMLALKSVIADKDGISTLIFDEIDAGVSGKTARKIGVKMLSLSKKSQLLCVTHSAQIASLADTHFRIEKNEEKGITQTAVKILDNEGRVKELSRILGGINVTDSQRAAAVDMLNEREFYKKETTPV